MKLFFTSIFALLFSIQSGNSDCLYFRKVVDHLRENYRGYQFSQSHELGRVCGRENTKQTIVCVLSRDTDYVFVSASNDKRTKNQLKMVLYDNDNRLVASNVTIAGSQQVFHFTATKTGIYHLECTWERADFCGTVAFGYYQKYLSSNRDYEIIMHFNDQRKEFDATIDENGILTIEFEHRGVIWKEKFETKAVLKKEIEKEIVKRLNAKYSDIEYNGPFFNPKYSSKK